MKTKLGVDGGVSSWFWCTDLSRDNEWLLHGRKVRKESEYIARTIKPRATTCHQSVDRQFGLPPHFNPGWTKFPPIKKFRVESFSCLPLAHNQTNKQKEKSTSFWGFYFLDDGPAEISLNKTTPETLGNRERVSYKSSQKIKDTPKVARRKRFVGDFLASVW